MVACEVSTFCIDYDVWIWKEVFFARTDKSVSLFSLKLFFVAHISSKMLCINCKQTKLPADSHDLCFRCCGFSQLSPCARSANWASEIWEELSHFPSYVSSGRGQAQGFPSCTIDLSSLNKMMKVDYFQMETAASIRRAIPPGAWAVSIDFMDAYLHIPIHPASRKYLRFSLEGTI